MGVLQQNSLSPYELVGGSEVVRHLVDRFYDLMDTEPAFADLRAMHAADLGPMRQSLAGFLSGWLGGPREWFEKRPGTCMMSMHRGMIISDAVARQWSDAMRRAVTDCVPDARVAERMAEALGSLARGMATAA